MAAALVPIIVIEEWTDPDGDDPTGSVAFQLIDSIVSPDYLAATKVVAYLAAGGIVQQVYACDLDSTGAPLVPPTAQYRVVESIDGAADVTYYATVPANPPGSRATLPDVVTTAGSITVTSNSAGFSANDLLAYVNLPGFPAGTQIGVVHSATSADLSTAAAVSGSGLVMLIGASVALSAIRPS